MELTIEQQMVREVFNIKVKEIDNAIAEMMDMTYTNSGYKKLMKKTMLNEKDKYIALQNVIINYLSD